jgi:hypothetical protein
MILGVRACIPLFAATPRTRQTHTTPEPCPTGSLSIQVPSELCNHVVYHVAVNSRSTIGLESTICARCALSIKHGPFRTVTAGERAMRDLQHASACGYQPSLQPPRKSSMPQRPCQAPARRLRLPTARVAPGGLDGHLVQPTSRHPGALTRIQQQLNPTVSRSPWRSGLNHQRGTQHLPTLWAYSQHADGDSDCQAKLGLHAPQICRPDLRVHHESRANFPRRFSRNRRVLQALTAFFGTHDPTTHAVQHARSDKTTRRLIHTMNDLSESPPH